MCKALKLSRSGYYAWQKRGSCQRELENEKLLKDIIQVHEQSRQIYGSPRIAAELKSKNIMCSKNRVARVMRKNKIRSKIQRKYRVTTTNSKHRFSVAANLLKQNFHAERPNQIWLSDITYLKVLNKWMYLVVILDLFSRQVISWALSHDLSSDFVLEALKKAVRKRNPKKGLIFHSDRGVQYASYEVTQYLKDHGIIQSMSRKGDCYDNAVSESFFNTFKSEFYVFEKFESEKDALLKIFDYIDIFYNHKRIHSSLKYLSPINFEKQFNQKRTFLRVH
jgi:transposase InsO family protein